MMFYFCSNKLISGKQTIFDCYLYLYNYKSIQNKYMISKKESIIFSKVSAREPLYTGRGSMVAKNIWVRNTSTIWKWSSRWGLEFTLIREAANYLPDLLPNGQWNPWWPNTLVQSKSQSPFDLLMHCLHDGWSAGSISELGQQLHCQLAVTHTRSAHVEGPHGLTRCVIAGSSWCHMQCTTNLTLQIKFLGLDVINITFNSAEPASHAYNLVSQMHELWSDL